jgi:hypothetical protein
MSFLNTDTFKTLAKSQKFETIEQANVVLPYLIDAIIELQKDLNKSVPKTKIGRDIAWQSDGATPEVAKALRKLAKELAL